MNLADYVFLPIDNIFSPIRGLFDNIDKVLVRILDYTQNATPLPMALTKLVTLAFIFPIYLVLKIIEVSIVFLFLAAALVFSPIILPYAVFSKGSMLEGSLVSLVFVPLTLVVARVVLSKSLDMEVWARIVGLCFGFILGVSWLTTLFYWLIQFPMLSARSVVGHFVAPPEAAPLAEASALAGGIPTLFYHCMHKTAEHSLTEKSVHWFRTWLKSRSFLG